MCISEQMGETGFMQRGFREITTVAAEETHSIDCVDRMSEGKEGETDEDVLQRTLQCNQISLIANES